MRNEYKLALKYICKKLVKQGFDHENDIKEYYKIIVDAAREEFIEDNKPNLDAFLQECFLNSILR